MTIKYFDFHIQMSIEDPYNNWDLYITITVATKFKFREPRNLYGG